MSEVYGRSCNAAGKLADRAASTSCSGSTACNGESDRSVLGSTQGDRFHLLNLLRARTDLADEVEVELLADAFYCVGRLVGFPSRICFRWLQGLGSSA